MANDPKIGVHVQTTADNKALEQTAKSLRDIKEAAGQSAPALQQQAAAEKQVTDSFRAAEPVQQQAVATTRKLTSEKKQLREGVTALKRALPELAGALDVLKSPYAAVGAAAAATLLIIQKVNAEVERMEAKAAAWEDLTGRFGRLQEVAATTAAKIDAFNDSLETTATKAKTAADRLGDANHALSETQRLQNELNDIDKAAEIAAIEGDGSLTPEQKSAKKAHVEKTFAEAKRLNDLKAKAAANENLRTAKSATERDVLQARSELPDAMKAEEQERIKLLALEEAASNADLDLNDERPELRRKIKREQETIQNLEHVAKNDPQSALFLEQSRERLTSAQDRLEHLTETKQGAGANLIRGKQRHKAAEDRVAGLTGRVQSGLTEMGNLDQQIERGSADLQRGAQHELILRSRQPGSSPGADLSGAASAAGQMSAAVQQQARLLQANIKAAQEAVAANNTQLQQLLQDWKKSR